MGRLFAAAYSNIVGRFAVRSDLETPGFLAGRFKQVTQADPQAAPMTEEAGIGIAGSRGILPSPQRITAVYRRPFSLQRTGDYVMLSMLLRKAEDDDQRVVTFIAGMMVLALAASSRSVIAADRGIV